MPDPRFADTQPQNASATGRRRLLQGSSQGAPHPGASGRTATQGASPGTRTGSYTATLPLRRPSPAPGTASGPRAAGAAASAPGLPGWIKGFVMGGVTLAVAMPLSVFMSRSMIVQEALAEQSSSKATLVCTAGEGRALDDSSLWGWLFGGSYFQCGDWETREARQQRERDQAQANFLARERARQQR